jgi:hypothetical protein
MAAKKRKKKTGRTKAALLFWLGSFLRFLRFFAANLFF